MGSRRRSSRKWVSSEMLDSLSLDQSANTRPINTADHADRGAKPSVQRQGQTIAIDVPVGAERNIFTIPLSDGFPIDVTDRRAPVFALYNQFHEMVGVALKVSGCELAVHLHKPVSGGRFYFQIDGRVGIA